MIVAIHQPDYIPYPGYFYKLAKSDAFVFLDDCQFSNDNMHNWNVVKTPQGSVRLKIPVESHLGDNINVVRTKDELKWKEKHLDIIFHNYKKSPFYDEIMPEYSEIIKKEYANLSELNIAIVKYMCEKFGFAPKFYKSSDMNIQTRREERVIDICAALGATEYLSGHGASVYQVPEHFSDRGIKLTYTDYEPIKYSQLWGEFLPNMSIVDYVFNCGFDGSFAK